jgi:hypothetical protein
MPITAIFAWTYPLENVSLTFWTLQPVTVTVMSSGERRPPILAARAPSLKNLIP